jgi:hypothetical protein
VRDHTARLIEEAVRRYDCDGLELDFNRFPEFFKEGTTEQRVAKMNSLVERVRQMLGEVGRERGRRLVLGVRVPSNYGATPPTPETARQLGCDVPAWVRRGWVDYGWKTTTTARNCRTQGVLRRGRCRLATMKAWAKLKL